MPNHQMTDKEKITELKGWKRNMLEAIQNINAIGLANTLVDDYPFLDEEAEIIWGCFENLERYRIKFQNESDSASIYQGQRDKAVVLLQQIADSNWDPLRTTTDEVEELLENKEIQDIIKKHKEKTN